MIEFIIKYWLQIGFSIIIAGISYLYSAIKKWNTKQSILEVSTRAHLKHKIIESYHQAIEKDAISIEEYESVVDLHESYKALGGNGTCERIYHDFQNIKIR